MEIELKKLEKNLVDLAGQVAQARHKIAQDLEAEIKQELQDLYMEKLNFKFVLVKENSVVKVMRVLNFTFQPILEKILNHW